MNITTQVTHPSDVHPHTKGDKLLLQSLFHLMLFGYVIQECFISFHFRMTSFGGRMTYSNSCLQAALRRNAPNYQPDTSLPPILPVATSEVSPIGASTSTYEEIRTLDTSLLDNTDLFASYDEDTFAHLLDNSTQLNYMRLNYKLQNYNLQF
jgi:hypothetical protein